MTDSIHKWEYQGLGKAPFRVTGVFELPSKSLAGSNPTAYNNALRHMPCPCGTCRVCGHGLVINYIIKDANGKLFPVGSECVNKAGDHGITSKVKQLRLQRDRERRQAKAAAKREAGLQAQRDANDGMTDYEVREAARLAEEQAKLDRLAPVISLLAPLSDRMSSASKFRGDFCSSIADDLSKGKLPYGNGRNIMVDILAKQAGRKNSKKFKKEWTAVDAIVCQAEKMIEA